MHIDVLFKDTFFILFVFIIFVYALFLSFFYNTSICIFFKSKKFEKMAKQIIFCLEDIYI